MLFAPLFFFFSFFLVVCRKSQTRKGPAKGHGGAGAAAENHASSEVVLPLGGGQRSVKDGQPAHGNGLDEAVDARGRKKRLEIVAHGAQQSGQSALRTG